MATVKLISGILSFHGDAACFAIIVRIFPISLCENLENRSINLHLYFITFC